MRKRSLIIPGIFLFVVGCVFSAALIRKKIARRDRSLATGANSNTKPEGHLTDDLTGHSHIDQPKAVFYTSVGGSSANTQINPESDAVSHRYTIEVAQVSSQSEAEQILHKMKSRGVDGFYTPVRRGGQVIYRIRLGVYVSADDAAKNLAKISGRAQIKGEVAKLQ